MARKLLIYRVRGRLGACLLAGVLAGCGGRAPAGAERCEPAARHPSGLLVAGSGANLALVRAIAARFQERRPGKHVHVPESIGTGGALRALSDGAIDLGLGSRPLKATERAAGFQELPLCRVALAPTVNSAVGIQEITLAELVAIYSGERAAWPDGTPIVPILREPGDSGNDLLIHTYPALGLAIKSALRRDLFHIAFTDQELRDSLHSIPGAIGFIDVGTIRLESLPLRALRLDGVEPPASGAGADYPLVRTLTFLSKGELSGEAREFVEFARSGEVADILASGGFLPPEQP